MNKKNFSRSMFSQSKRPISIVKYLKNRSKKLPRERLIKRDRKKSKKSENKRFMLPISSLEER
jgi:hypothetical protein